MCCTDDGMNSRMNVALSTGLSDVQLLCRDEEISQIKTFLHERLARRKPGSMYVSGPPGTGKTACVQQVLEEMKVRPHRMESCSMMYVTI